MTICDTNIWYDLHELKKLKTNCGTLTLVPTVIKELANSPKLEFKFGEVKKACENIFKYGNELIIETPLEYLLKLDRQLFDDSVPYINLSNEFEVISMISDGEKIREDKKKELKAHIQNIREILNSTAAYLDSLLIIIRGHIENRRNHRAKNSIDHTKEFIRKICVKDQTNGKFELSDNFDWNKIELFLYALDMYFKDLETNTTMSVDANDFMDLFHMLYVKPNDKYWTLEVKKWHRIIKAANMERYLI